MEYFTELDIPLAPAERQALARLEWTRRAGRDVSPFPGHDAYSRLRARHDRPAQLRRYHAELEALTFGEIETSNGGATWRPMAFLQTLNLFAKQQAYDDLKTHWQQAGHLHYALDAQQHLAQQARQEAARIEQVSDPAQHNGDPAKAAIAQAITRRLYAVYRQYVEADLARLAAASARLPAAEEGARRADALPLAVLALRLIYERQTLSRGAHANQLAQEAGHRSGDGLYNQYCKYSTTENRVGFGNDTARKGLNMIARIRAALPGLSKAATKRAEDEIATIEARIL